MQILEYGNPLKEKIILIHGFESPYQIWEEYIEYYQQDYHLLVVILPGHNVNDNEEFISFEKCAKEIEDYYLTKYVEQVYAIYGMSMGGVLASYLWNHSKLEITKLILESSPILGYNKLVKDILIKQYLKITHKAQARDEATVKQAINTMISEDKLDIFLQLIDHITDSTITNYINEIAKFRIKMMNNNTKIYYLYGGAISEVLFKKVAKYLEKNYLNVKTICFKGKGHCEDALINPKIHIKVIDKLLK